MSQQMYSPNGPKSNTPTLGPIYKADQLKTDLAYRYGLIDAFTTHLNNISDYADRVSYYLDMTVAMGFPIPDFYTGLSVNVFEGKPQFIPEETEDGWEPQSAGKRCPIRKPRDLAPLHSTKEWKISPQNSRERGILCKLWFERVRFIRFPHLIFNKQDEYREWINQTKDERIAHFNQNSVGRGRAAYAKTELGDIENEMVQFLQDFAIIQRERDLKLGGQELINIQNIKARDQQRYKAESEYEQPFDLIRKELSGRKGGINWSAFTQGRQLECFGILWGMVEYWQWLEAGAIELVENGNVQSTNQIALPLIPVSELRQQYGFTVRQAILYVCYETSLVINKGESYYDDYIIFATSHKRMAYSGDSPAKARRLIGDIEKVRQYLSEGNRKLADNEINIIRSKIV